MLGMVVVAVLAQSGECRFKADWWLPVVVNVSSEQGAKLGSVGWSSIDEKAPRVEVELNDDGARLSMTHQGTSLTLRSTKLPVSAKKPPSFGHGYTAVPTSLFEVVRIDGAFVEVIPWRSEDFTSRVSWKPQRIRCSELRLSAHRTSHACTQEVPTEIFEQRDGPVAFLVNTAEIDVKSNGRTTATLFDGSVIRGWSTAVSSGSECFNTDCDFQLGEKLRCDHVLELFANETEKIGTFAPNTFFLITARSGAWTVVRPVAAVISTDFLVRTTDLAKCEG